MSTSADPSLEDARGWVADLVIARANKDRAGERLLLATVDPAGPARHALRILADIAVYADPRLVELATRRPFTAKSAAAEKGRRAA
jgi:hypothetical protein